MMNGSYMMRFVAQQQQQATDGGSSSSNIPMYNGGNGYHCSVNAASSGSGSGSGSGSSISNGSTTHGFANGSSKDIGGGGSTMASKQCINL